MTWSNTVAIDILNFYRENTLSVLVLPPQARLHLFGDVIVTTPLPKLFLQGVILQGMFQSFFDVLSLGEVIVWFLVLWHYWLWLYGHFVCLIGLGSRHLHLAHFGWRLSFQLGIMRLFVAMNGLVYIWLVILHNIQFFPISCLRISLHLVKFDDCGLILGRFMLLEWRIVDLLATILLLKLLHFLVTNEMGVFDNAVCVYFRLCLLLFYGSELLVKDN